MRKRTILLLLSLLFTIESLKAQALYCEISGDFASKTEYRYVYLVDLKLKTFIYVPILKNHFKFVVTQPKKYTTAQLFFEMDSTKDYNYFLEQSKRLADNRRIIAIEEANLLFEENANALTVKKGQLNEDIVQMYNALNSGDYKTFFDNHTDSPISLTLLKSLLAIDKNGDKYNYKLFYDKLSERLKDSKEGKEVLSKL